MSAPDGECWGDQHRGIPSIVKRPVLPIELIQYIVNYLDVTDGEYTEGKPDHTALSACSLVCHTWHDICRPRIFHSITIHALISRFSYLHSTAPHLRKYVQVLRVVFFADACATIAPPGWLKECLAGFENLRTLQLDRHWMSFSYRPSVEDQWMQWITNLLAIAPRVLAMDNWVFDSPDRLLHILASSSTLLEDLTLSRISVSTPTQSPDPEPVPFAPTVTHLGVLRNLTLHGVEPSILAERAIECPNLNSFSTDNSRTTGSLPPWIPKELTKFTLHVRRGLDPTFCFPKTPHLSDMSLLISGTASSPEHYTTWIENCINHSSFPKHLHRLSLNINLQMDWYYNTDYPRLSRVLQGLHTSGRLEFVAISIVVTAFGDLDEKFQLDRTAEVEKLENGFAPLLKAGILHVEWVFQQLLSKGRCKTYMHHCV